MLILPSVTFSDGFHQLKLDSKTIDFYTLIPIYTEELELKMKKGVDALFDGFDKFGVSDILDLNRPNTVKRKKTIWSILAYFVQMAQISQQIVSTESN